MSKTLGSHPGQKDKKRDDMRSIFRNKKKAKKRKKGGMQAWKLNLIMMNINTKM